MTGKKVLKKHPFSGTKAAMTLLKFAQMYISRLLWKPFIVLPYFDSWKNENKLVSNNALRWDTNVGSYWDFLEERSSQYNK